MGVKKGHAELSTGIDVVDLDRFRLILDRGGDRFLRRVYTTRELERCEHRARHLAATFAAKEAISKAMGMGILIAGLTNIEVLAVDEDVFDVILRGRARERAEAQGLERWSVSLSHTPKIAIAFATAVTKSAGRRAPSP